VVRPVYSLVVRLGAQTASSLRSLAQDEPIELVVSGPCMTPYLEDGDRVQVSHRRVYKPGDIVAFRRQEDERLLVHRVLGYTLSLDGLKLLAKGDRISREDEPVDLHAVVGRVVSRGGRLIEHSTPERWRSLLGYLRVLLRRSVAPWLSAISS